MDIATAVLLLLLAIAGLLQTVAWTVARVLYLLVAVVAAVLIVLALV